MSFAYQYMFFSLVATPYCPLVFNVGALSSVILFHTHVYHIYNDYICSFQEGNQELYSVDCGEQANLFNVHGEMSSGLQRLLSALHRVTLCTSEGRVQPSGMIGQTQP